MIIYDMIIMTEYRSSLILTVLLILELCPLKILNLQKYFILLISNT